MGQRGVRGMFGRTGGRRSFRRMHLYISAVEQSGMSERDGQLRETCAQNRARREMDKDDGFGSSGPRPG